MYSWNISWNTLICSSDCSDVASDTGSHSTIHICIVCPTMATAIYKILREMCQVSVNICVDITYWWHMQWRTDCTRKSIGRSFTDMLPSVSIRRTIIRRRVEKTKRKGQWHSRCVIASKCLEPIFCIPISRSWDGLLIRFGVGMVTIRRLCAIK